MNVTLEVLTATEDEIVAKIDINIPEDRNWELYELFVMPKTATYTIDPKARDIKRIGTENWFFGDKCEDKREKVIMNYDVCEKHQRGTVETIRSCD